MPLMPVAIVNEVAEATPPSNPVAGSLAWYDASDVASITTISDAVSQWDDQSGNGNNLTQTVAGDRPLYGGAGARTINGVTVVEFVSSDFLNNTNVGRNSRTQTAFVVGLWDSAAASGTMLGINTASGGNQFRVDSAGGLTTLKEGISTLYQSTAVRIQIATPFIACQRLSANAIDHFAVQSGKISSSKEGNSDSTTFTSPRSLRIGVRVTTEPWDGLMAEILIYDSTLSDSDVLLNLSYLKNKWGIADIT